MHNRPALSGNLAAVSRASRLPCRLDEVGQQCEQIGEVTLSSDPAVRRAAGRRRRLHRGYQMWDQDRRLCAEPTRRAILLTFTVTDDKQGQVDDAMRRFWAAVRRQWPGTRYFCWLELTKRGNIHYQAWWINPPHAQRVGLASWVARTWSLGFSKVSWPRGRWSEAYMANYVAGYVKKMGSKAYQQEYANLPRGIRTFMTQRTDIPVSVLKDHIDGQVWEFIGEAVVLADEEASGPGRWEMRGSRLRFVGERAHVVPAGGYCTAVDHARRRHRPRWHLPAPDRPPAAPRARDQVTAVPAVDVAKGKGRIEKR